MKNIKYVKNWLLQHPKVRQWGWFIVLWLGGLLTVAAIAYPIKYIIRLSL